MNEEVLLLEPKRSQAGPRPELPARSLSSSREVAEAAAASGRGPQYWVAQGIRPLLEVLAAGDGPRGDHRIVVLQPVDAARLAVLDAAFHRVLVGDESTNLLPLEELVEVLASRRRGEFFIGGVVDKQDEVVVLYRGNMEPLLVPTSWFEPSGNGVRPDFDDFGVTDFGQTVRLGEYEAAADAILYEFDAGYRRKLRRLRHEEDRSFGACLRRLRLQKGVARDDFPGVSEKQIARIERGETGRPRAATLAAIAARLGVRPEEIEEY
jgi:helix-turn-helix protein